MNGGVWKVAAVLSAVTLTGIYVYDQTGGQVLPRWGAAEAASHESPRSEESTGELSAPSDDDFLMPGSKSDMIMPPSGSASPQLMYSSKSGLVKLRGPVTPETEGGDRGPGEQAGPQNVSEANAADAPAVEFPEGKGLQEFQLMPGSKSPGMLFPPQAGPGK